MNDIKECAVIGYGSWATTIVGQLTKKGTTVHWLITNPDVAEGVAADGHNPKYVSDLELDTCLLKVTDSIDEAVADCEYIILACPSVFLKSTLSPLTVSLQDKFIISAIKGIVPDELNTVLEYIHDTYGLPFSRLGVISGPSHAEEVSRDKLSYLTAVGTDEETNVQIAGMLSDEHLIIDTSTDIYGIEYAAVLKNIYAIAAGLAAGLGYGDNFLAVLIAACATEMDMFLSETYPFDRRTSDRAYLGDLLVTCYSNYSRNRRLGLLIGRGCSVKSAINEMTMVAEGYYGSACIHSTERRKNIVMPVADMVYSILYEKANPRKSMAALARNL